LQSENFCTSIDSSLYYNFAEIQNILNTKQSSNIFTKTLEMEIKQVQYI
jgi:hypothetical protein